MPRKHSEIVKQNSQEKRALVREEKTARGKGKPIGREAVIKNLFRRSEKKQRAKEYTKLNILAMGGSSYWPPLTKKGLELLKKKINFTHNGFIFEIFKNSTPRRTIFKTQMKIGRTTLSKTTSYFEIDFEQRTIRFAPEWKLLDKPNITTEEKLYLIGQKRI